MTYSALLIALSLSQTAPATTTPAADPVLRAAEAAEHAAEAAQKAAEAAQKAAEASQQVAQTAPAAPTAKSEKPAGVTWSGSANVNFISLTGNAQTLTFGANGAIERRSDAWIFGAKANVVYGRSRAVNDTPTQVTALGAALQLRADRRFSQRVAGYLLTGGETDHVKSLEYRAYGEGGASISWVDDKQGSTQKALVRTDFGVRYSRESRFQYYPTPANGEDLTLVAPRLGVGLRYALTADILFAEDAEVLTNVIGDSRTLVNSTTAVTAKLTERLTLTTSFTLANDSQPAPGKVSTDTQLQVGLGVIF